MNDQAFSQSIFSRIGTEQLIEQVESFLQVYTEAVFVLLLVAAAAIAWMTVCEVRRARPSRSARRNPKPAAVKTRRASLRDVHSGGLQISQDSIY